MFTLKVEIAGATYTQKQAVAAKILRSIAAKMAGPYVEDCGTILNRDGSVRGRWMLTAD